MAMRTFKCPSCGYRFRADPEKRYEEGEGQVVRGWLKKAPQPPPAKDHRFVDLTCPNCKHEFEEEV